VKEGKGLLKVIKSEAKAEKASLEAAIKELSELQKLQKEAIKVRSPVRVTLPLPLTYTTLTVRI